MWRWPKRLCLASPNTPSLQSVPHTFPFNTYRFFGRNRHVHPARRKKNVETQESILSMPRLRCQPSSPSPPIRDLDGDHPLPNVAPYRPLKPHQEHPARHQQKPRAPTEGHPATLQPLCETSLPVRPLTTEDLDYSSSPLGAQVRESLLGDHGFKETDVDIKPARPLRRRPAGVASGEGETVKNSDSHFRDHFIARDAVDSASPSPSRIRSVGDGGKFPPNAPPHRKRHRSPRISHWKLHDYSRPETSVVPRLNSSQLRVAMLNEARKIRTGHGIDVPLWRAFSSRCRELQNSVKMRTKLRWLQAIASAQLIGLEILPPLIENILDEVHTLRPVQIVFILQALSRLRCPHHRISKALHEMILAWTTLPTTCIIKAVNALAKLGFIRSETCLPLKAALADRLAVLTDRQIRLLKPLAILYAMEDQVLISFLELCSERSIDGFLPYSRPLQIVELHLRLRQPMVYASLSPRAKTFLEDLRRVPQSIQEDLGEESGTEDETSPDISTRETIGSFSETSIEDFCPEAAAAAQNLGLSFAQGVTSGPFSLDLYHSESRTVLELNTHFHFYDFSAKIVTQATALRRELLEAMGLQVVCVDAYRWHQLPDASSKENFLRAVLPSSVFVAAESSTSAIQE